MFRDILDRAVDRVYDKIITHAENLLTSNGFYIPLGYVILRLRLFNEKRRGYVMR